MLFGNVDFSDLSHCGWGVIFSPDVDSETREALRPLLEHRRAEACKIHEEYYREYTYEPSQSAMDFLGSHGSWPSSDNPAKIPSYLLLVGGPQVLPFRFQYELAMARAVGRLHFDNPEDYSKYATTVVASERRELYKDQELTFFGVNHDPSTRLAADNFLKPVSESMRGSRGSWKIDTFIGHEAKKSCLARLLDGASTPALLVTSCHGLMYPRDDPRQFTNQGAFLCQDWPGPSREPRPIDPDFFFCAKDLDDRADLTGLITFHLSCYSAGTPEFDNYSRNPLREPRRIADQPFVSQTIKRLLALGAFASIGHVDRAWTHSFADCLLSKKGGQVDHFTNMFRELLGGHPVGAAMAYLTRRSAQISVHLSNALIDRDELRSPPAHLIQRLKTAFSDARNYILIGDPATRLLPSSSTTQTALKLHPFVLGQEKISEKTTTDSYHSCFISYSHSNKVFAERLCGELQALGIRCWLDAHDMRVGDPMLDSVNRAIRHHDKLLLCCSVASLNSSWVEDEVAIAFEVEREEGRHVLIPLDLDGALFDWKSGKAPRIRERLAADFTGWENDKGKFEEQFERVVRALRTKNTTLQT